MLYELSRKFLLKIRRQGVKRTVILLLLVMVQNGRKIFYSLLSNNKPQINNTRFNQPVLFSGLGKIKLGKCFIGVWPSPHYLSTYAHIEARAENAEIIIGNNTWINNNAVIIADKSCINIGNDVLIGHNIFICDSDFHSVDPKERLNGNYKIAPVFIMDNVFIGSNVNILKGVTIGKNSVIANGSIVVKDIPENVLAGGVPAKVIRQLD